MCVSVCRQSGADITIGCLPCEERLATAFGLMKIDEDANVTDFSEKPKGAALKAMQVDTTVLGMSPEEALVKPYIASMGIYVFKRSTLLSVLSKNPEDMDFGGEVIPRAQKEGLKVKVRFPIFINRKHTAFQYRIAAYYSTKKTKNGRLKCSVPNP